MWWGRKFIDTASSDCCGEKQLHDDEYDEPGAADANE
jgi:hypothetical protein